MALNFFLLLFLFGNRWHEILPLLVSPEDLLCVGGKIKCTINNCAQVFVLLRKFYIPPVDCADSCSQLPLFVGIGHHHLFGLLRVEHQDPFITPLPILMQHWAVVMLVAWEQGQENCVIRIKGVDEWTQPWGEPVVTETSEKVLLTSTLRDLLVRKPGIHRISWWSRWKRVESFSARMCGCRVLNAEERPANSSMAVVLGCSRFLCSAPMMSFLASSTPLPARYVNWRGSITTGVVWARCCVLLGPPDGSHHLLRVKGEFSCCRLEGWDDCF